MAANKRPRDYENAANKKLTVGEMNALRKNAAAKATPKKPLDDGRLRSQKYPMTLGGPPDESLLNRVRAKVNRTTSFGKSRSNVSNKPNYAR